jgi:uncharacterized membrane protein
MRITGAVVLGIVCGALAGVALSELVALLGLLLFDRPLGLRFLPVALGVAGGLTAGLVGHRHRTGEAR